MPADLDRTLAALAEPNRRAIVERLGHGPSLPSELADSLGISRPALSRHLRQLKAAGVIEQGVLHADARARPIRLRPEPFDDLSRWLDEVGVFWGEQLASFKVHAEQAAKAARR